jgi:GrpB-like predicted nucleotidyltransferase (UPF0157 family)
MTLLEPVVIVPPVHDWPRQFQAIGTALRRELGELALRIDHIGSTAVPGLAAKDVIDVQVTVAALDLELLRPAIERVGLLRHRDAISSDHRPPGATGAEVEWNKLFFAPPAKERRIHVHVRVLGRANQRYALLFRDYLRAHPPAAEAYAELKRRLAALGVDSGVYADVKDPVCDLIMIAAEAWAEATAWQPGPSDA